MTYPLDDRTRGPAQARALDWLWWVLLFLLLTLSAVLGPLASLLTLVTVLIIGIFVGWEAWRAAAREPFAKLFLAGFTIMAVTTILSSREPADALNVLNFLPMVLALPVYAIARMKNGTDAVVTVSLFCLAGLVVALAVGILDLTALGKSRSEGLLNNAIVFGRTAAVMGFLGLGGFFVVKDSRRYWFLLAPALGTIVLVLSGTRGGMLALPGTFLISLVAIAVHSRQRLRVMLGAALLLLVLLVAGFIVQSQTHSRMESLIEVGSAILGGEGEVDRSTSHRLRMYEAGYQAFNASPILGHGWAHLTHAASTFMDESEAHQVLWSKNHNHLHNDLLNFAVASGVPGIVAFVLFLAAPLVQAVTRRRDFVRPSAPLAYLGSLVAIYAVAGLFDMTIGYDVSTTVFAFTTALVAGIHYRTEPAD